MGCDSCPSVRPPPQTLRPKRDLTARRSAPAGQGEGRSAPLAPSLSPCSISDVPSGFLPHPAKGPGGGVRQGAGSCLGCRASVCGAGPRPQSHPRVRTDDRPAQAGEPPSALPSLSASPLGWGGNSTRFCTPPVLIWGCESRKLGPVGLALPCLLQSRLEQEKDELTERCGGLESSLKKQESEVERLKVGQGGVCAPSERLLHCWGLQRVPFGETWPWPGAAFRQERCCLQAAQCVATRPLGLIQQGALSFWREDAGSWALSLPAGQSSPLNMAHRSTHQPLFKGSLVAAAVLSIPLFAVWRKGFRAAKPGAGLPAGLFVLGSCHLFS